MKSGIPRCEPTKRILFVIFVLVYVSMPGIVTAEDFLTALEAASTGFPPGADIAGMGNAWTAAPNFSSNNPAVIAAGDNFKFGGSATYGLIGFKNNKSVNIYSSTASARLPVGTLQVGYSNSNSGVLSTDQGVDMKLTVPTSIDVMYGLNVAKNIFREGDRLYTGIGYGYGLSKLTFPADGSDVMKSRSRGNTYSAGMLYSPDSSLNVGAYYAHGRDKNEDYDITADETTRSTSNSDTYRLGLGWQALSETFLAVDYQHRRSDGQTKDDVFAGIEQGIIKDRLYIYGGWAGSGPTLGMGLYFGKSGLNIAYMNNPFDELSDHLGRAQIWMFTGFLSF